MSLHQQAAEVAPDVHPLEEYLGQQVDKATAFFLDGKPGRAEYELARAGMKIARYDGDEESIEQLADLVYFEAGKAPRRVNDR